jgi:hypothetical protein
VEDKLLDIYEFGVPATWQKRFLLHDFDPLQHKKEQQLKAKEEIFEEYSNAKSKANPRDRYKGKEGKSAYANRSSGYTRNQNKQQINEILRATCPATSNLMKLGLVRSYKPTK